MSICSRTTAGIRRHADKEHYQQDPKTGRYTNLCVLVDCSYIDACLTFDKNITGVSLCGKSDKNNTSETWLVDVIASVDQID